MADLTGKTLGNYRVLERIGRGGMASVYRAFQPSLERIVAIKVIHEQLVEEGEEFLNRFHTEAKAVATMRHPNIVQVYDFGIDHGIPYMVMEFLEGTNLTVMLRDARRKGGGLAIEETVNIFEPLASAVEYAHRMGMTHRDLKPGNVMLTKRGDVVLTDFGIARIVGSTQHTATGAILGTPAYMSPEQGRGDRGDNRIDIYALGVMLYEMTAGRVPFEADTPLAVILKHISDPLPLPRHVDPSIPEAVENVILKALAKDPDDRYQSADVMSSALRHAVAMEPEALHESELHPSPAPSASADMASEDTGVAGSVIRDAASYSTESRTRKVPTWIWMIGGAGLFSLVIFAVFLARSGLSRIQEPQVSPTQAGVAAERVATEDRTEQTAVLPTTAPEPTTPAFQIPSTLLLHDDFADSLAEGWEWVREDPSSWSVQQRYGFLRITLLPGGLGSGASSLARNLLLRDAPEGDFEIATYVEILPSTNFQFAGLLIYQDDATAIQLGRAYCDNPDLCVGNGIYFDNTQTQLDDNYATDAENPSSAYLRIQRRGSEYTGYYSDNGTDWITIGRHNLDMSPIKVGFIAAQAFIESIEADFQYFTMKALP